tara:strand:- start:6432 stop:6950 length:519 start_codon:yes stop_codon:yes gene_type:complete
MASNTFDCGTNYLQPTGFKVLINRKEFPNLQFYAQSVIHPDANLPATETNFSRISSVPFVGDAVEFGTLQMDVLLDENMNSYRELYNWLTTATDTRHVLASESLGRGSAEYKTPSYYDISVGILSSHNNLNRTFTYINAFPTSVGSISLGATVDEQFLTFPVTFRFDYFQFN